MIIGWIREGDKAACGGMVVEGVSSATSHGLPYTFQGARIACTNNCVIAEGYSRSILANGHSRVIHGMKTTGGCPLHSTLNDLDGVGNSSNEPIPTGFLQDYNGQWTGNMAGVCASAGHAHDEQFLLLDGEGRPLAATYYTAKLSSGERIYGETDDQGKTQRFHTAGIQRIEIYLGHSDS